MDAALDQLGVDEQEAEIQILDEPQKGLFGRLRVEARVRARVRPTTPRAKVERRDRGRRNNRRRKAPRQTSSNRGTEAKTSGRSSEGHVSSDRSSGAGSVATGTELTEVGTARSGSGENQRRNGRKRRRKGGRQRDGSQQGAKVADNESTGGESPAGDDFEDRSSLDIEAQQATVDEFLTGLMSAFGRSDVEVLTKTNDEAAIVAEVEGNELGLLVGPKGQTLQALHELTRSVVQRRFVGEAHARLFLDVAGYRQRRTEALERFAQTVATEVLSSGRSKALDPMSASDRKVIHDIVNTIDGVRTLSEGEEPQRRVVIEKSSS